MDIVKTYEAVHVLSLHIACANRHGTVVEPEGPKLAEAPGLFAASLPKI